MLPPTKGIIMSTIFVHFGEAEIYRQIWAKMFEKVFLNNNKMFNRKFNKLN